MQREINCISRGQELGMQLNLLPQRHMATKDWQGVSDIEKPQEIYVFFALAFFSFDGQKSVIGYLVPL